MSRVASVLRLFVGRASVYRSGLLILRLGVGGRTAAVSITVVGCGTKGVCSIDCTLGELKIRTAVATSPRLLYGTSGMVFPNINRTRAAVRRLGRRGLSAVVGKLGRPILKVYLNVRLVYHRSRRKSTGYLNVFSARMGHFVPRRRVSGIPRVK